MNRRGIAQRHGSARAAVQEREFEMESERRSVTRERRIEALDVSSPAFEHGDSLPIQYTADGEGLSPPLRWENAPSSARSMVMIFEDADSPTPEPIVHGIAWLLGRPNGALPEGALNVRSEHALSTLGLNSFLRARYLPPDPPPGHGPHRYVFQVFAVDYDLMFEGTPGRGAVLQALAGHVLAVGHLQAIYQR
jgi:Raf kinase inhibitor-like YbhB/YbcL family protein